jgi:hypothetical protein
MKIGAPRSIVALTSSLAAPRSAHYRLHELLNESASSITLVGSISHGHRTGRAASSQVVPKSAIRRQRRCCTGIRLSSPYYAVEAAEYSAAQVGNQPGEIVGP